MIRIQLDEEETLLLSQILENCMSDLRMEIADTDNYDYKLMLKSRKAVLTKLIDALEVPTRMAVAE